MAQAKIKNPNIVDGTIDELKLDTSVNASLDLADTALQPTDIASGTITPRADDINFSGGSDGDVLTVQADGSIAVETPAGGSGFTPVVNNYTSSTTMADPGAGCKLIRVRGIGGGAGGGSGRKHTSAAGRGGGSGGSAGAFIDVQFKYTDVSSWPVTITIGAGGAGAAAQTSNSSAGLNGTNGSDTSFGSIVVMKGGDRGLGGSSATLQGGMARVGSQTAIATVAAGAYAASGGQAGVTAAIMTAGAGGIAGSGGAGGCLTSANAQAAGTNGGQNELGSAGGAGGAVTVAGSNGADGNTTAPYISFGGSGGGGGGSSTAAGVAGGNGGLYGAGGGGGTAGTDSVHDSGPGGDGADGFMQVIAT